MKKRANIICLVVLVLALSISLLLAGCTARDDRTQTKAGVLLPLSGTYEKEGNYILSGIMAEANESGSGIEYIIRDTGGDPETALEEIRKLHSSGIDLIIGPLTEDEITNVIGFAGENDMILLLPFENSTDLPDERGTVYRISPGHRGEIFAVSGLINDLSPGSPVILVIHEGSDAELEKIPHFGNYTSLNIRLLNYLHEDLDYYLATSGAPEIAVWTGSPVNGSEAVKTIREYGPDTAIILSESSASNLFTENAGSYAEGVYGIEYPGGLSEEIMYEYYGHDTAMVLEEALAGGADTIPEIREELDRNIVTGYTGVKYFRDGSTAPPYYIIIKVENGTWVKDDEYSARLMARISAVYGGALEFDPLLNDDHARLPLPHGIYD
ncbi:ABC transporter substrate-binding protein [Methanolacinia paynteri]|uniref:ABC transporter substrate-binding protein n=1 Tax=Methanolacinia paynteri TaxID=230356 RepID=UPI00064FFB14|nr:penicillin-binding protein activator [Methanolacinia paynteri]